MRGDTRQTHEGGAYFDIIILLQYYIIIIFYHYIMILLFFWIACLCPALPSAPHSLARLSPGLRPPVSCLLLCGLRCNLHCIHAVICKSLQTVIWHFVPCRLAALLCGKTRVQHCCKYCCSLTAVHLHSYPCTLHSSSWFPHSASVTVYCTIRPIHFLPTASVLAL